MRQYGLCLLIYRCIILSSPSTVPTRQVRKSVLQSNRHQAFVAGVGAVAFFITGFSLVDTSINGFLDFPNSILRDIQDGDVLDLQQLRDEYGPNTEYTIVARTEPSSFTSIFFPLAVDLFFPPNSARLSQRHLRHYCSDKLNYQWPLDTISP